MLSFATAMPIAKVAAMTAEHDTRIWRVLEHHVHAARDQLDLSGVKRVGMDETAAARGQDYLSIFADLDARRVVFATEGRSADTVERFATDLAAHGGDPAKVTDTSSERSTAFISGIRQHLPNATMTFDRYHLPRHAQRSGGRGASPRAHHPSRAHPHPVAVAEELEKPHHRATPRAPPSDAPLPPNWPPPEHRGGGRTSRPSTTRTPATHPSTSDAGVAARNAPARNRSKSSSPWSRNTGTASSPGTTTTSATPLLEGINSLVQTAKARARGYRSKTKMITIVYLAAAKLQLPTLTHPIPSYMTSR